jgi:hypothetical protein
LRGDLDGFPFGRPRESEIPRLNRGRRIRAQTRAREQNEQRGDGSRQNLHGRFHSCANLDAHLPKVKRINATTHLIKKEGGLRAPRCLVG